MPDEPREPTPTAPQGPVPEPTSGASSGAPPEPAQDARHAPSPSEPEPEIGFGSVVGGRSRHRLLNRSGSFNVHRRGLGFWTSLSLVHVLLTTTWPRFLGAVALSYLAINLGFAGVYVACGPGALQLADGGVPSTLDAFDFSVQTFATIGYGGITPVSTGANVTVFLESLVGLLWVALATGLIFARAVRPTTRVRFSADAVVAPHRGGRAFMFRLANLRKAQLFDIHVDVVVGWLEQTPDGPARRFARPRLELDRTLFLPLSWTVVHALDDESPMARWDSDHMTRVDAEFLVLLSATDESTGQVVHARTSYKPWEVKWGARFRRIFETTEAGEPVGIDLARLDETEPAELPPLEAPGARDAG
ncbi:MAG: transporter [Planctomycetes bacterium]|nr:transporter [Planctomycetota bacterium]